MSALLVASLGISGFLSDRYGRKKIIAIKVLVTLIFLTVLIVLGLIGTILKQAVLAMYFLSLLFASSTFDIVILGFESLTKNSRDNYVILLSATRTIGILIICALFYFLVKWAYFIIIVAGLYLILISLFIKYTYESPHFILTSTG